MPENYEKPHSTVIFAGFQVKCLLTTESTNGEYWSGPVLFACPILLSLDAIIIKQYGAEVHDTLRASHTQLLAFGGYRFTQFRLLWLGMIGRIRLIGWTFGASWRTA